MKQLFLSFVAVGMLILFSCSKNELPIPNITVEEKTASERVSHSEELGDNENIIYIIDGQLVDEHSFEWNVEGMIYHINIGEKENPESKNIYYTAFLMKLIMQTLCAVKSGISTIDIKPL